MSEYIDIDTTPVSPVETEAQNSEFVSYEEGHARAEAFQAAQSARTLEVEQAPITPQAYISSIGTYVEAMRMNASKPIVTEDTKRKLGRAA